VRTIRQTSQIPIVLYTYLNPIVQFGWDEFHAAAAEAGVDGLLILDLPPEEDTTSGDDRIVHVRLVAPTTPPERMKQIAAKARGFIYYVSREGVTGVREGVSASLPEQVKMLRQVTDLPIAVGFGISTPDQARAVAETADGVVVGSAIVSKIAESGKQHDLVARISEFVRPVAEATKR
jgi:tryptophan synthase alpha chain